MRHITALNLGITTVCQQRCPTCCCNIPRMSEHRHIEVTELLSLAPFFTGLQTLMITGGEPTLHPDLPDIVKLARQYFVPQELAITTNGSNLLAQQELLAQFDTIHISVFDKEHTYPGNFSNKEERQLFQQEFPYPEKIVWEHIVHLYPRLQAYYPCSLSRSHYVAWQNGLLYPCCPAPGQHAARGIAVTTAWQQELIAIPFPCHGCPFAWTEEQQEAYKSKNLAQLQRLHQAHRQESLALHALALSNLEMWSHIFRERKKNL